MKIIEQFWIWADKPINPLKKIEIYGRTCYKSEDKITDESAEKFVEMIIKNGHHSVLEHVSASVRFITNRGVTHELVRHRLCAFSQESTRYVNYGGKEMEFILPVWWGGTSLYKSESPFSDRNMAQQLWLNSIAGAEKDYNHLISLGWNPGQAREVLPNSLKTEIVLTANLREWRHIFKLRTSKAAHPQMRALMIDCLTGFKEEMPAIFNDINPD